MAPLPSRRALLAGVAGGLAAVSGCVSSLGDSAEATTGADLTLDALGYRDGFGDESARLAGRYGNHGVWGLAEGPGVDGPTYAGAWRDAVTIPEEGSGADAPWIRADAAAVVYRLDAATYRVWLWVGARAHQPDGSLGRTSVTRLRVGARAGDGWSLLDYAPRGAARDGPVPVSLDDRGPSGRTPLPGGGLALDGESTETGPRGGATLAWQGIARGTRSANAVCALGRERDEPFRVSVTAGVAGGRGAL